MCTPPLPRLDGTVSLVTGGNSGLGFETVRALAATGGTVVLAARSERKAADAIAELSADVPDAALEPLVLDLADLSSVAEAAAEVRRRHDRLDRLIANAGVMMTPERTTADGFELQLGTNHLGHFALVGRLLPLIVTTPGARVVTVSSGYHRVGEIDLDDLMFEEREYTPTVAYAQSKLANLVFALELQRRLAQADTDAISVGAHPGYAATNLQHSGPGMHEGLRGAVTGAAMRAATLLFAQSAAAGARPQVVAATAPGVGGGDYLGPKGPGEMRGQAVGRAAVSARARDTRLAVGLWEASAALTGERYGALVS